MTEDGYEAGAGPAGDERLRALLRHLSRRAPAGDALAAIFIVRRRVRRRRAVRITSLGTAVLALVGAGVLVAAGGGSSPSGSRVVALPPVRLTGALVSFTGCTDYLTYVRREAARLVGAYGLQGSGGPDVYNSLVGGALSYVAGAVPAGARTAAGPGQSPDFSGTNDQVTGVDEPDTVKTDGRIVLTLTGATLRVFDTSAHLLGTVQLPGDTGGGLLLDGDRAVVLSTPSSPPSFGGPGFGPLYYRGSGPAAGATTGQAAVVDLSDPAAPHLARTFTFDGSVVAARLVGDQVRVVLRSDGPRLTFQTPTSEAGTNVALAANRRLVATSTLADWLPSWQVQNPDGSTSARQPLAGCDALARPRQASGISTVSVFNLDPQSAAPGPATSVVAAGDTVYATAGHLYVAGMTSDQRPVAAGGGYAPPCCPIYPGQVETRLYEFVTPDLGRPVYLGSGIVPGSLLSSYALDEDARGYLRVVTTVQGNSSLDSRITVLHLVGPALTTVGRVTGLGRGQQLRAVRFIGDTAYVVTFRSFDPLYVVDLRDPYHPVVAGALEQPGFSEFLYPLPNGHLLGVGVEIDANEPAGLLVATYDVSDPRHPRRIHVSTLARGFYVSYGGYDPHAFLYWQPDDLAVLALPDNGQPSGASGAAAYRVSPAGTLTPLATLAHRGLTPDRTVVIGSTLWAVTEGGILVADLGDLHLATWHPY